MFRCNMIGRQVGRVYAPEPLSFCTYKVAAAGRGKAGWMEEIFFVHAISIRHAREKSMTRM